MLKKFLTIFLVFLTVALVVFNQKTPVFNNYAHTFEVYIEDNSSLAKIVRVEKDDFLCVRDIKGESFKTEKDSFSLFDFLNDFSATVIFTESIEQGVSYYAYSPKITYEKAINGKKINIQIFIGQTVTVGSPLIYGGF